MSCRYGCCRHPLPTGRRFPHFPLQADWARHWARPLLLDKAQLKAQDALQNLVDWALKCSSVIKEWEADQPNAEKKANKEEGDRLLETYGACCMIEKAGEKCGLPRGLAPCRLGRPLYAAAMKALA